MIADQYLQVDANGLSWRSGARVEKVKLKQWFFRITAFKEALLNDLDTLSEGRRWPDNVISMQRHWLGKSAGARIRFQINGNDVPPTDTQIFTTRPDTLFGVQYLALSTVHPVVQSLARDSPGLQDFLALAPSLGPDSKAGYRLPGLWAKNPVTYLPGHQSHGEDNLPVYVAPYVLGDYGGGAVMGVPGHDLRDMVFWAQHDGSAPLKVVDPPSGHRGTSGKGLEAFVLPGILNSRCGPYAGMRSAEAAKRLVSDLQDCGDLAEAAISWRLRDWLVSRQRYWGTPIPMIHCQSCGPVPVPIDQLPVMLPHLEKNSVQGRPGNPLEHISSWVNTTCPECGGRARRDTDTMDTFVDSSWYYLRFADPHNETQPVSSQSLQASLPIDTYIGGIEHAILHLLYARFIYKFLASTDVLESSASAVNPQIAEPFMNLISQGMVHGKTYSDPATGRFLHPSEVSGMESTPVIAKTGAHASITWEKMSKSKHNGVDPSACVEKYGADAVRAHILFSAPVSDILDWDEGKIVGIQRWLQRVFRLATSVRDLFLDKSLNPDILANGQHPLVLPDAGILSPDAVDLYMATNSTIVRVGDTMGNDVYSLNTAVSDLIKLTNRLVAQDLHFFTPSPFDDASPLSRLAYACLSALLRMMAPIAPAFAEECWEQLHQGLLAEPPSAKADASLAPAVPSIFDQTFPVPFADPDTIARLESRNRMKTCTVQINGKLRFTTEIAPWNASMAEGSCSRSVENYLAERLLETPEGKFWLTEKHDWHKRKRVVVVGNGRLVNVVF